MVTAAKSSTSLAPAGCMHKIDCLDLSGEEFALYYPRPCEPLTIADLKTKVSRMKKVPETLVMLTKI